MESRKGETSQTFPVKYTGTKFAPRQQVSAWLSISQFATILVGIAVECDLAE